MGFSQTFRFPKGILLLNRERELRDGEKLGRLLTSVEGIFGWSSWLVFSLGSISAQFIEVHLAKLICKVELRVEITAVL